MWLTCLVKCYIVSTVSIYNMSRLQFIDDRQHKYVFLVREVAG